METELIVVNDGSRDTSVEEILAIQSTVPIELIQHETNLGIPKTFYDGLSYAATHAADDDCICMIEGDGTSDIQQIPAMVVKMAEGADVVVASRVIAGGAFLRFPWFRKLGSLIVNYFVRFFARVEGITDYTIFFRAYRARCLKLAIDQYHEQFIVTKSFAANLEVLLKIQPYIKRVAEVPLVYDYGLKKGKSKIDRT
jgi:glycosyltransferase involved in cell wall biosynthesis